MRIALISLDQTWEDKEENKKKCSLYIELASNCGCDLIVFPEMTLTGFTMEAKTFGEKVNSSKSLGYFKDQADKYKIDIVAGFILDDNANFYNCSVLFQQGSEKLIIYKKIHPFSFSGEDKFYKSGSEIIEQRIKEMDFGFTVCYDLRFPELYQALSKDVTCVINIANWPEKRIDHWNTLLKARAIENQIYMIGVNRTGLDGNMHTYVKSSMIYDADGSRMKPVITQESMDIFDLDLNFLIEKRRSFPVKRDRQTEFYKKVL